MKIFAFTLLLAFLLAAQADYTTHELNLTLGYLWAAPDGYYRPVIHVNGQFPAPTINVTEDDELIVHVRNELFNEATSIHWHGLYMKGYADMDGSPQVTQDYIPPYSDFTYKFRIKGQHGTYWYHSHNFYQTGEGLFGALIVNPKNGDNLRSLYDEELVVLINDWTHSTAAVLMTARQYVGFPQYYNQPQMNMFNPLINGKAKYNCSYEPPITDPTFNYICNSSHVTMPDFTFKPGFRYRLRIINVGIRNNLNFTIEGHKMLLINQQGTDIEQREVDSIQLFNSQRMDVVVTANQAVRNYWMKVTVDKAYRFAESAPTGRGYGRQTKAAVRYVGADPSDFYTPPSGQTLVEVHRYDQVTPASNTPKPPKANSAADRLYYFNITFGDAHCGNVWPRGFAGINPAGSPDCVGPTFAVNGKPMFVGGGDNLYKRVVRGDKHPTLRSGELMDVNYNEVVDVVIQNTGPSSGLDHIMHLHGYKAWVLGVGEGIFNPNANYNLNYDNPPYLDSWTTTSSQWYLIRFHAKNPGLWMMHCHMEGHSFDGVMMVFNIAPDRINHFSSHQRGWDTVITEDEDHESDDSDKKKRMDLKKKIKKVF